MSYLDIPIDNNPHFCFDLLDQDDNIVEPQFPISIGCNFGYNYNLGCRIKIHDILSEYNLSFDDLTDATLYLFGTNYVGDMNVFYSNSSEISDSPITPNYLSYVIPLGETYNTDYSGCVFKMSTPNADTNSVFTNMSSYIRIEFNQPNVSRLYIDSNSKMRYFNGDTLHKSDFTVKAELSNHTERTLTSFNSSLFETTLNTSITSITITAQIGTITGYSCSSNIYVFPWGKLDENYIHNGTNPQQTFDIYGPAITENNQTFPVVVTIHGGGFDGGQKEDYNYITPFIINNGCIHVNMNYRLMSVSNDNNYTNLNGIHYQDMLDDIGALIEYLCLHASSYHIDISKIVLMGYSAGGNLALVYGLRNYVYVDSQNQNNNILFKAIITEGAVTFSELSDDNGTNSINYPNDAYVIDSNIKLKSACLLGLNATNTITLNDIELVLPWKLFETNYEGLKQVPLFMYHGIHFDYGSIQENENSIGDGVISKQDAVRTADQQSDIIKRIAVYLSGLGSNIFNDTLPIMFISGCGHNDNYNTNYKSAMVNDTSNYRLIFESILLGIINNGI